MDILSTLLSGSNSGVLGQLAQNANLSKDQTRSVLEQLVPAIGQGVQNNLQQPGGVESLMAALSKGNHQQYLDRPELLADSATRDDGNGILGHVFGSKDVSRQVASQAASDTGLDSGLVKRLLPVVASLVMASLSKQTSSSGLLSQFAGGAGASTSGATDLLGSLLGNTGGSPAGGLIAGLAKSMFK